jgi:hypothetical protein
MTTSTESLSPLRGAFVRVDPGTGVIAQILAFPRNAEALSRTLVRALGDGASEPRELITFTLPLEATNSSTNQLGIYPLLSALELLLYVPGGSPPLILFVWGSRRVLPIRVLELQVKEQQFDAALTPLQAELALTLQVLKTADLGADTQGRQLWNAHLKLKQVLSNAVPLATLADIGLGATEQLLPPLAGH